MDLGNLDFKIGSVNPSGIGTTVYCVAKEDISEWPTIVNDPDATGAEADDLSTYDGNFTLKSGKVFSTIYSTQGKGKATYEATGETDCKMFTNKLSLSYPKLNAAALSRAKMAVNGDFVYIFKQDGKYHVIGSADYRVVSSFAGDTGDAAGSAKGCNIEIEAPDVTPLPIYTGTLALAGGTLNCATGAFTPTPAAG